MTPIRLVIHMGRIAKYLFNFISYEFGLIINFFVFLKRNTPKSNKFESMFANIETTKTDQFGKLPFLNDIFARERKKLRK